MLTTLVKSLIPQDRASSSFTFTSYADYTGKIVDTAKPGGPFSIMWDSNNGPAIAQFTNPNPTTAPYKTRVFLNAGGAYRIKLRVNDGTNSDVDKANVFVPRQIGSGGDVFVNSYTGLQKLSDINIPISENQNVGFLLVNRIRSPYLGQYVHIFINGTRYFTSLVRGQINQDVESVYARKIYGSGNLHVEIYGSSNNPDRNYLDEVFLVGTKLYYY